MTAKLLIHFITQYGYAGLYLILGISILGIPIPDETLMAFVGFLSYTGKIQPVFAILSAALGSITGITVAYFLGRFFGRHIMKHLEKHAGKQRLQKVFDWYHRHGGKLLTIGYFIPGVRHLSGYIAGISQLNYGKFAFFAYLGAILWTSLWITLGRLLGSRWNNILPIIHRYALILGIIVTVIALAFYLIYRNRERWLNSLSSALKRLPQKYLSLGRRRLFVTVSGVIFIALFIFLMGLIEDLVTNEVGQFDQLVAAWLQLTSPPFIIHFMQIVNSLGTHLAILIVFIIAVPLLYAASKSWYHIMPLGLAWGGGTLIDHLFRFIFRGQSLHFMDYLTPFQAPSAGFLLAGLSFYTVLGYLIARNKRWPIQLLILIVFTILLGFLGLSPIYLRVHSPSSVVTGMTVSGLWALVCIFLYEFDFLHLESMETK